MPRSKHTRKVKKWTLHIDADLANEIEQLLIDPMTGKVITGSRGRLIEGFLSDILTGVREGKLQVDPINGHIYRRKETA